MRIATYNINGMNARLPVLLRWLEQTRPDVACLQELKSPQERFPQDELRALGYEAIWHGQKSWNGVAILARAGLPIETRRGLAGRPRRQPQPLPGSRGGRADRGLPVPAQRQPGARARSSTTSCAGSSASSSMRRR